jgi:glucan phosphoethanolaminetransferase (alkaline phosphatase superfamily)
MTLSLAISAVVASAVLTSITDATTDQQIKQEPLQEAQNAIGVLDIGVVVVNASFYLSAIILATRIRSNPVFAIPSILFVGVGVWLSSEIANIYFLFGDSGPLASVASNFELTNTFFQNLPVITLGFSTLLLIVIYTGVGRKEVRP